MEPVTSSFKYNPKDDVQKMVVEQTISLYDTIDYFHKHSHELTDEEKEATMKKLERLDNVSGDLLTKCYKLTVVNAAANLLDPRMIVKPGDLDFVEQRLKGYSVPSRISICKDVVDDMIANKEFIESTRNIIIERMSMEHDMEDDLMHAFEFQRDVLERSVNKATDAHEDFAETYAKDKTQQMEEFYKAVKANKDAGEDFIEKYAVDKRCVKFINMFSIVAAWVCKMRKFDSKIFYETILYHSRNEELTHLDIQEKYLLRSVNRRDNDYNEQTRYIRAIIERTKRVLKSSEEREKELRQLYEDNDGIDDLVC